ncbi:MAG: PucC family protein, partial [Pseudomonadota bacterium]
AMALARSTDSGIALGAWGAVQASAAGSAIAIGGLLRDVIGKLGQEGLLGPALSTPSIGYSVVYHLEILLLFAAIAAIGPLARFRPPSNEQDEKKFGLPAFPG